jgi:hypothetical protein
VGDCPLVPGDRDLSRLLASIDARLQPGTYVFCSLEPGAELPGNGAVQMLFKESEGTTVVLASDSPAAQGLSSDFACEWIVIGANSDLAAVGFLAALSGALAQAGLSANIVSAYHHDHVFVPAGRGRDAVAVLQALQQRHRAGQP